MKSIDGNPLVFERTYKASVEKVWKALTDPAEMKKWYFDVPEFLPQVGNTFQFTGGTKEKQFLHLCRVTEVVPNRKIAYTWKYDGYTGESLVTFELFPDGNSTRVRLTHAGLDTFPVNAEPALGKENFNQGWKSILDTSLKRFLEQEH